MKKEVQDNTTNEQNLPKLDSANTPNNEVLTNTTENLTPTPNEQVITPNEQVVTPQQVPTPGVENVAASASANGAKGFGALLAKLGTGKIIAIIAAVVIVIGGVVAKIVTSTPKAIFKSSINNISKQLDNAIDDLEEFQKTFDTKDKALYFKGDVTFDTNIDEIKNSIDISKYKLGMDIGINPKGSEMLLGASVSGDSSIDGKIYFDAENAYIDSSVLDNPINITELLKEEGIEVGDFEEYFESIQNSNENVEDYTYVVKAFKKAFIKTLDSSKMEKSSAKMEVDGKNVRATKVTYKLTDKVLQNTVKVVCDELKEDDKFIASFAKITNREKSEVRESLKDIKESAKEMDYDEKIEINIYVSGVLNDIVGYDVEVDGDTVISYYTGNKKAELKVYSEPDHAAVVVLSEEKKKETVTTVRVENKRVAEITTREVKDDGIDLDFVIDLNSLDLGEDVSTIKGSIKITAKQKKDNISGEYEVKINIDDQYVSASGSYSLTSSDKLDIIKTSDAITIEDIDFDAIKDNIEEKMGNDELGDMIRDSIDEIEENSVDLNYYGMKEVTESDAIELLKKERATVLYVGETSYSSYLEEDEYDLFYNLRYAQDDYDFYSYYLDSYDVTSKFEKATKDAPYSCKIEVAEKDPEVNTEVETPTEEEPDFEVEPEEPTCKKWPAIYFIKDGKIVKALRSDASESDIIDALEEIGKK